MAAQAAGLGTFKGEQGDGEVDGPWERGEGGRCNGKQVMRQMSR